MNACTHIYSRTPVYDSFQSCNYQVTVDEVSREQDFDLQTLSSNYLYLEAFCDLSLIQFGENECRSVLDVYYNN